MMIKKIGSTMVKPATTTPTTIMWMSNVDTIMARIHMPNVYFYRSSGAHDFFDAAILKASLSRTLVEFYPLAGRLNEDVNGRIEINCSAEGALFVEAECDATVDDFADGKPKPGTSLVPRVDYSQGISTFPLLVIQVTRFKCGGVGFGYGCVHTAMDGLSSNYFIHTWAELARGGDVSKKPFLDRRILAARNPPRPQFPHIEYQPPPTLLNPNNNSDDTSDLVFYIHKLTPDKLSALRNKCQDDKQSNVKYSTYEAVAGHVWRCVTKARGLPEHQETRLSIPVDGRSRLRPPLPPGYVGNVVFRAAPTALCGELESNPLEFAVRKIHDSIAQMDDDYMRSAIDHLEMFHAEYDPHTSFMSPNLGIVSWAKFGYYDIDFGWGRPINFGFNSVPMEGLIFVVPSPGSDGGLLFPVALPKEQMMVFQNLFYDI